MPPARSSPEHASLRTPGAGTLLRGWRTRRRLSQLDLAGRADVSTRHLSYVETGRSTPSRELLLHLARHLDVPRREQNQLLLAAGYAPMHTEFDLADPSMVPVVETLHTMLAGNEPNPTLVMDRHWNLVMANDSALALTAALGDMPSDIAGNVIRLTFHPLGLASMIENIEEVAAHLLDRLRRQLAITGDPAIADLIAEAEALAPGSGEVTSFGTLATLPIRMRVGDDTRSYVSVVSTFGAPLDITTSELVIETFYAVES